MILNTHQEDDFPDKHQEIIQDRPEQHQKAEFPEIFRKFIRIVLTACQEIFISWKAQEAVQDNPEDVKDFLMGVPCILTVLRTILILSGNFS